VGDVLVRWPALSKRKRLANVASRYPARSLANVATSALALFGLAAAA